MPKRREKPCLPQRRKDAKVFQIALFPPLLKGDERGISGFLCVLSVLGAINFLDLFCETITLLDSITADTEAFKALV